MSKNNNTNSMDSKSSAESLVTVKGHVNIVDDKGTVLLDKVNAVHPQNLARVITRAWANENNYSIYRVAFGNGGTLVNSAFVVSYKTPNDGQSPDVRTWDSRLYNETYSEIVDEGNPTLNPLLGTDPGSAGPNAGTRPGGGANPANDPTSTPHVSGPGVHSNELGLTSEVVITSVLNSTEPEGQLSGNSPPLEESTDTSFTFDEIGIYTSGAPAIDSNGINDIFVGNQTSDDNTGLLAGTQYSFVIDVNGGGAQVIQFVTPAAGGSGVGGEILYGDICEAINTGDIEWNVNWSGVNPLPNNTSVAITDNTVNFPTITGAQTYGFLRFTSGTTGISSTVLLSAGSVGLDMIASLNPPTGGTILDAVNGKNAGVQNDPINPLSERERLLTHILHNPILKSANRTLTVTYTLTVSVARS